VAQSNVVPLRRPTEPPPHEPDLRLVADRVKVYPRSVSGPVRRFKWAVLWVCLSVYYLLPWLRWGRGAGRPDQAFLLDLAHERLYILGWEFWPQEVYFLAGVMVSAAVALFLVTSLIGRVWCGYTCPQTVWTDLFMWVERRIEGDRNARMKRDAQALSWDKAWRKLAKHGIWLGVAFWTGGAWIMYFVDAPTVTAEFWTGRASIEVYFFTGLFAATTYLLAGWAREQVCTYMCPWPRFQAAMLDEQTFTVTYQTWRGEPRGKKHQDETWDGRGDCIDCKACVHVCPTGIDIRDGQQLECINCGLCVDACNEVMTKLDRPNWLINWDNLARQAAKSAGQKNVPLRLIRPRTVIYLSLLAIGAAVMTGVFFSRATIALGIQRDRAPLFVRLADGGIRNAYTIKVTNKTPQDEAMDIQLVGLDGAQLIIAESGDKPAERLDLTAPPDTETAYRVLVHGPGAVTGSLPVTFILHDRRTGETVQTPSAFLGPGATDRR
jgi:cytochrome c oxidase accessory protein FixG